MNEETRRTFKARTAALSSMRRFMEKNEFMEVETPMLHPIPGGAAAKPFTTHHNALDMQMFLRIAPELYLKRLVVGGFDRVFEVNRNFRNEGVSIRHNPEFTMMEFYAAYTNYTWLMDFTEAIIRQAAVDAQGTAVLSYGGRELDLSKPFQRLTIVDAINKYAPGYTPEQLDDAEFIKAELKKFGVKPFATAGLGALQLALFEETAESQLWEPTYIIDYPVEVSPLARASDTRAGHHRAFRAVHGGPRNRQRLLGAERSGRPGGAFPVAGRGQGCGRRRGDVLRRRLHPRAGIRHAAGRWLRHRDRSPDHDPDGLAEHSRRAVVPALAERGLKKTGRSVN